MKKKYQILLIAVLIFGVILYFSTDKIKTEKMANKDDEKALINNIAKIDYEDEFDDYRDNAWRNEIKSTFEELFNVNLQGFGYIDISEVFSQDIINESIFLASDIDDYYPFGFTNKGGQEGYILILENDGTSHLWEVDKKEEGEWVVHSKDTKQGEYLDIDVFYEEVKKEYIQQNPEAESELNA